METTRQYSIQRRIYLGLHQGKTIINENNVRRFRNVEQFPRSVKSLLTAWFILTKTEISIEEIDAQETGLGLIGSGNRHLTRLSETLFGWSSTFHVNAL